MIEGVYDHTCSLCPLAMSANTVCVEGIGWTGGNAMVVGEAPGFWEDEEGIPFVGPSGELLDECLEKAGVGRLEVFVTNSVKCRPPENRDPTRKEMDACLGYLYEEATIIRPRSMLLLGNIAMQAVLKRTGITTMRGKWVGQMTDWGPLFVLPTYHPAFCKRQPQRTPDLEEDIANFAAVHAYGATHSPGETWAYASPVTEYLFQGVECWEQTDHGTAAKGVGPS